MDDIQQQDEYFMWQALKESQKAYNLDEVPIGALIVQNNKIVGRGHNMRETQKNPILHAEIVAIQDASVKLGGWRLPNCTLYVTIEPCPMCAGAILQSRINRLVYGAPDLKAGCAGTLYNLLEDARFNHRTEVISGILKDDCASIIKQFFAGKRNK